MGWDGSKRTGGCGRGSVGYVYSMSARWQRLPNAPLLPLRAQSAAARGHIFDPWTSEQDNNLQWQSRATSVRGGFGRCERCFDGEEVPQR